MSKTGPSPRVRGSLPAPDRARAAAGSIPACAGKPPSPPSRAIQSRVHPRVCGEARSRPAARRRRPGPSPRVRGSPRPTRLEPERHGSIPACAGKPTPRGRRCGWSGVHPRVCGEASREIEWRSPEGGPSPRVRGSHRDGPRPRGGAGSIPACAGKPPGPASSRARPRVHPRVCGEAGPLRQPRAEVPGPSPRVRGSPPGRRTHPARPRSIPACAGKPRGPRASPNLCRVHPRVCGEASSFSALTPSQTGPSPRVRGSRRRRRGAVGGAGSIPACAGKPTWALAWRGSLKVHPRVCGEADPALALARHQVGPSPRVRGSPDGAGGWDRAVGSIPACAGKPTRRRWSPAG